MRSVRVTTLALVLVIVGLVAALAVGTLQSRENAKESARLSAEKDVAISTWPRSFVRVPAASTSCDVVAPSICLYSEETTEEVGAKVAVTIGSSTLERTTVKDAPDTYTVRGTIGNDLTPVVVTVRAHPDASSGADDTPAFNGADITVALDGRSTN